jgi:hypothetical protein
MMTHSSGLHLSVNEGSGEPSAVQILVRSECRTECGNSHKLFGLGMAIRLPVVGNVIFVRLGSLWKLEPGVSDGR